MKSQPHIPMSPAELPQQRIHEVVPLPARPQHFECRVGYEEFPEGVVPGTPRSPTLLVQVEWAQTPMNCGIEAFYLQARKKHWVMWLRTYDDNWSHWNWLPIGYCLKKGIDRTTAASHLLVECWKFTGELRDGHVDRLFDWINEEGLLSRADVRAIMRELSQEPDPRVRRARRSLNDAHAYSPAQVSIRQGAAGLSGKAEELAGRGQGAKEAPDPFRQAMPGEQPAVGEEGTQAA